MRTIGLMLLAFFAFPTMFGVAICAKKAVSFENFVACAKVTYLSHKVCNEPTDTNIDVPTQRHERR
jgi:hypothetical protein